MFIEVWEKNFFPILMSFIYFSYLTIVTYSTVVLKADILDSFLILGGRGKVFSLSLLRMMLAGSFS